MANSSDLGAGDVKVLKNQYNALRADVLDATTGHDHSGAAGHGVRIRWCEYVCVRDKKAQNTPGGTFTSGAWRTRDINEEIADTGNICSIASNQITLAAGTYRCLISAPAFRVNGHQIRLYNVTDAVLLVLGTSEWAADDYRVENRSFAAGRFTLTAQKVLEVQHYCTATFADTGFGNPANITDEIYTVAEFWKESV